MKNTCSLRSLRSLAILSMLILGLAAAFSAPLLAKSKPRMTESVTGPGCSTSLYGGGYCVAVLPLNHPLPNDNYKVTCTGPEVTLAEPISRSAFLVVMRDVGLEPSAGYMSQQVDDSRPRFAGVPSELMCAVTYTPK